MASSWFFLFTQLFVTGLSVHVMTTRDEWKQSCSLINSPVIALSVSHTLLHSHLVNVNLCYKLKETETASHEIPETAYWNTTLSHKHVFATIISGILVGQFLVFKKCGPYVEMCKTVSIFPSGFYWLNCHI